MTVRMPNCCHHAHSDAIEDVIILLLDKADSYRTLALIFIEDDAEYAEKKAQMARGYALSARAIAETLPNPETLVVEVLPALNAINLLIIAARR